MRGYMIALVLTVVVSSVLASSVSAQSVIFNYTIHVDFFAYSCSLDIIQVSLYDSAGRLVSEASSPSGGEIAIALRMPTPLAGVTATASGLATWSSYYTWPVSGSGSVTLGSPGDYWVTIRMN